MKLRTFISRICLVKSFCKHLFGTEHTVIHRIAVGTVVIFFGVFISKLPLLELVPHNLLVHFALDALGYGIHGIGLTPFIDLLLQQVASGED